MGMSITNQILSTAKTLPIVGHGATVYHFSDRTAYEVLEVSEDKQTVKIAQYTTKRTDSNGISEDQEYAYLNISPYTEEIVWRKNAWYRKFTLIDFIPKFYQEFRKLGDQVGYSKAKETMFPDLFDENNNLLLVPNKTKVKTSYDPISITFRYRQTYIDPSF